MAGVFANALETITELSTAHAFQYLGPIWGGVLEQLQKLCRYLVFIQPLVEDAEERQLTDQAVRCWLLLLKDVVYDAEDILDEAKTHELLIQRKTELSGRRRGKVSEFFSLDHNPLLFKLQLGKKLGNVNERINGLIEEMRNFNLRVVENNRKPWRNRPQTYSYVHESRVIVGRDEDKEKLVQMLTRDFFDEKVAVVSIVGMGGLGKTTLAQLVYADERVKNQFEPCIWVCVSDDFDVPKLAGKIIHTASGEICDHSNMEVLQKDLREVLGQKRYLLVLDDVWNEEFQKWDVSRRRSPFGLRKKERPSFFLLLFSFWCVVPAARKEIGFFVKGCVSVVVRVIPWKLKFGVCLVFGEFLTLDRSGVGLGGGQLSGVVEQVGV